MNMFKSKAKSEQAASTAMALTNGLRPIGFAWGAVVLLLLTACTTVIPRLDARFDTDTLGALPPSTPAPTPPSDTLVWRTQFFTPTVVNDPAGGRSVRVVPLPAFTASPDDRRVFLIASTEPFTTSPVANIRGSVQLRLVGLGTVGFGLRLVQGGHPLDYIGGVELTNFLPPSIGSATVIRGFSGTRLGDPFALPSVGPISGYSSGNVIDINWTIDQASRTFTASILGGASQSVTFPAVSESVATTPVQVISISFWMQRPTSSTVVFIDKLLSEEYR